MLKGKQLLGMPKGKYVFGTVNVGERGQIVIPKNARSQFGIQPGDTLLVLGDAENGLFLTKPELINNIALSIFQKMEKNK